MEIALTQGKVAVIDDADYEIIKKYSWNCGKAGYVVTEKNGKSIYMHRLLLSAPNNFEVDHVDGDKLNNRRSNLRICTRQQNERNKPKTHGLTSRYKGVSWITKRHKWCAQIHINRRPIFLGYYDGEEDAAIAYNLAAEKLYGEFARLNSVAAYRGGER